MSDADFLLLLLDTCLEVLKSATFGREVVKQDLVGGGDYKHQLA